MRAIVWLVVAGCGRISFDDRALRDGDIADTHAIDAPRCVVNHDEDGDGIDDCTDVCPHISDPGQVDTDGDRVGDTCDPQFSMARQQIVFFDGFASLAGWTSFGATVSSDELVLDARGGGAIEISRPLVPAIDRFEVGLRATMGGPGPHAFAIVTAPASPPGGYYCEMYDDGTSSSTMFTWTFDNSNYMHSGQTTWPTQRLGTGMGTFSYDHAAGSTTCNSLWNGEARGGGGVIPAGITPEELHLYAENVLVKVQYIIQIRTN